MKIERPKILNAAESTIQETAKEPAQLEKSPLPKTDSVEMKPTSLYNFDNAPKLDPSQSLNAKEVPATLIPGVPFREKAELAKTLPGGAAIDGGVASGDLGLGKTRPGPNHMGIDLRGNDIRNQLNDALNLHQGSTSGGTQITGLGRFDLGKDMSLVSSTTTTKEWGDSKNGGRAYTGTNEEGFAVTGTKVWTTDDNGVTTVVFTETMTDKPGNSRTTIEKGTTGDGGVSTSINDTWVENRDKDGKLIDATHTYITKDGATRTDHLAPTDDPDIFTTESYSITAKDGTTKEYDKDGNEIKPNDGDTSSGEEYVNPDGGPAVGTTITPEALERAVNLREGANTTPSNTEDQTPIVIDPKRVYDPMKDPLVTDKNPEYVETTNLSHDLSIKVNATGPDGVNPNDPELGSGGEPIVNPTRRR